MADARALAPPAWHTATNARGEVDAHTSIWAGLGLTACARLAPDGTWTAAAWRRVGRRTLRECLPGCRTARQACAVALEMAGRLAARAP